MSDQLTQRCSDADITTNSDFPPTDIATIKSKYSGRRTDPLPSNPVFESEDSQVTQFIKILNQIPSQPSEFDNFDDQEYLSVEERSVILKELEKMKNIGRLDLHSSSKMIAMIFRFYMQSKELKFFVKRLKNVAQTKINFINRKKQMMQKLEGTPDSEDFKTL